MTDVVIDAVSGVLQVAIVGLIGLLFAWIRGRMKSERLSSAMDTLEKAATVTVAEIQQTTVKGLKAASADGNLTKQEAAALGRQALKLVKERMGNPTKEALAAAGLDLEDIIKAQVEAAVLSLKQGETGQESITTNAIGFQEG